MNTSLLLLNSWNTIKKRFTIYKLRADVHLSDETDEYQIFAIIDEHGDKILL